MNRVIKFRAWDNGSNTMLDWSALTAMIEGKRVAVKTPLMAGDKPAELVQVHYLEGNPFNYAPMIVFGDSEPALVLMQYTGLKDKNGREIYEGDVLEFEREDEGFFGKHDEPVLIRHEVRWDTHYGAGWNFGVSHKDGDRRWSYPEPPEDAEVIGNIYENPELVKGVV